MLLALKFMMAAQVVVQANLAVLTLTPTPLGPTSFAFGQFNSTGTTAIVATPVRPSFPDPLGDQNLQTPGVEVGGGVAGGGGLSGTMVVTAPVMDDIGPANVGFIEHVLFYARGAYLYPGPALLTISEQRFKWSVGADSASIAVTPFPTLGPDESGPAVNFNYLTERVSATVLTQPNGNPWTWASINALANVKVEADFSVGAFGIADMFVGELWAEVYGQGGAGGNRRKIIFKLGIGVRPSGLPIGTDAGRKLPIALGTQGVPLGVPSQKLVVGTGAIKVPI